MSLQEFLNEKTLDDLKLSRKQKLREIISVLLQLARVRSHSKDIFFQGNIHGVTIKGNVSKEGVLQADLITMGKKWVL